MVRCKMTLTSITRTPHRKFNPDGTTEPATMVSFTMNPVCGGDDENDRFFSATPSGQLQLACVNPKAVQELEEHLGGEFYVDLHHARK